ncbi:MAG: gluconate 2-dehydrogenase subunit 3 family protein [Chitinophagaceae bacterium]|nr:MAG: gluconate 2-dehydrogenase subunit 3 family protein [Chitinophagaceae bacterium]
MTRKEAVHYISVLLGGSLVGTSGLLEGCRSNDKIGTLVLGKDDLNYLDEIADTILPATGTPGAKAAGVGAFIISMVNDCYDEKEQRIFREGLTTINKRSVENFGKDYLHIQASERHTLFTTIDREQKAYTESKKEQDPPHYFRMIKELTLLGYFTSKPGCTQAKRYMPTPGKYVGCVPYTKGEKAIV